MVAPDTKTSIPQRLLNGNHRESAAQDAVQALSASSGTKASKYALACSVLASLTRVAREEGTKANATLQPVAEAAFSVLDDCSRAEQVEQGAKLRYGLVRALISVGALEAAHSCAASLCRPLARLTSRKSGLPASVGPAAVGCVLSLVLCASKIGHCWELTLELLEQVQLPALFRSGLRNLIAGLGNLDLVFFEQWRLLWLSMQSNLPVLPMQGA